MTGKGLTEKQKALVDRLVKTGFKKNTAHALVFVASRDEAKRVDIEKATGLKQPEVSMAMQELRERGWAAKRDIKKEGRGTPVHAYYLDASVDEVIKAIEEKEEKRVEEIKQNLDRIKELADTVL